MRNYGTIILIISFISFILYGCEKSTSDFFECSISEPETNSKVVEGNSIEVVAIVNFNTDDIKEVVFSVDGVFISAIVTQPYILIWDTENYSVGNHAIKASAISHSGLSSEDEITVEIIEYSPIVSITDSRDGNSYRVIEIGKQVWMAENLRYKNDLSAYVNNNDFYTAEYGYLYQTNVAIGVDVCPDEWHIPSSDDWAILIDYLGGDSIAGGELKETGTQRWKYPNSGATNSSGFTALPAGSLKWNSAPQAFGRSARFFTDFYSNYIFINFDSKEIEKVIYHPSNEYYSIRCVRDY